MIVRRFAILLLSLAATAASAQDTNLLFPFTDPADATQNDDRKLHGPTPSNAEKVVEYDPATGQFNYSQKLGQINYKPPTYMTFDEYSEHEKRQSLNDYWKQISKEQSESEEDGTGGGSGATFRPTINVENEGFDRIFGGNEIEIRPNGSAELTFGVNSAKTENPAIPVANRRISTFDFRQNIQLNVVGNIGDKLKIQTNFNTQATFDFENQMKLEYTGYEDEIIQKIELGNVSLPLQSTLITGSQALFGVKTHLKFGKLDITSVYSQQKSERKKVSTEGGAQEVEFDVSADDYEAYRHYFLSHFFRDEYEKALATPPIINSSVNVTRVEVWVTNTNFSTEETRNIIAFQDLGESRVFFNDDFAGQPANRNEPAANGANKVYGAVYSDVPVRDFTQASQRLEAPPFNLRSRFDYQKVELARKLQQGRDFNFNPQLGYLSIVQEIQPNQVLAVAFEYTYKGKTYKVGEFSNENTGSGALILKMLKSSELNTHFPMWDLMMKNVYSLGAYQLSASGFELGIWYLDKSKGIDINYLPIDAEGFNDRPLLQVVGLDRMNGNSVAVPDGVFDFLASPLITVNPTNGRIFFPVLEPFGDYLRREIISRTGNVTLANSYAFDSLYTNTQVNAQYNYPALNRFSLKGRYQSSKSSEIRLNAYNIPEGSVVVTAGGQRLVENQDYQVDYQMGIVTIINQGLLQSGAPIDVELESNSTFGLTRRALFATRLDYKVNDELNFGGTFMNLSERPMTQKVNYGDEPISNSVVGLDGTFSTTSKTLTSLVDRLPLIDTKAESNIQMQAEVAKLIPGHNRAIGAEGNSYIDDFEGSQSTIDLRSIQLWSIASTPQGQPDLFPEGASTSLSNTLNFNKNRAVLNWHNVDNLFYRSDNTTPQHIKEDEEMLQNQYMRQIFETEVFPNRQFANTQTQQALQVNMFDLKFFPEQPGPYNYDLEPVANVSAGLAPDGTLNDPNSRWGGVMRRIDQTDFDAANIAFIQFWMMDPYAEAENEDPTWPGGPEGKTDGSLYINIGNISEDVLKDEYKAFENGFPTNLASSTDLSDSALFSEFGRLPEGQQIVNAFDNNPSTREFQDVGLDGLRSEEEREYFSSYVNGLPQVVTNADALATLENDPSHDDYIFYRDDDYDAAEANLIERYRYYNGLEGNSPTSEQSAELNQEGYPTSASIVPDNEDINRDNTLDNVESYFQYKIEISESALSEPGRNYINSIVTGTPSDPNAEPVKWYQFRIPIADFERKVGNIQDFRSIRFMRVFVHGFEKPIYLRFARMELVRGEWREYIGDLDEVGETVLDDPNTLFNIGAVNIEEHGSKEPVNYVLPPQLQREIQAGTVNLAQQNEQSLSLQVEGLEDGTAKAAFRNIQMDMRSFKKMEMFLHAESMPDCSPVSNTDLKVFVRVGADFTENYYEYETPISITPNLFADGAYGKYSNNLVSDQEIVWPLENNVVIEFEDLFNAKRERNSKMAEEGITINQRYEVDAGAGRKIVVVGNPNLADARVVMIGVRNPAAKGSPLDDGLPKCAEIWANELRLTHFDQFDGEAAMARISANLADFASVNLAGTITTPGWGDLEDKVSERQRETITNFDASAQVNLDKFIPSKIGLKVPMYVGYANNTSTPQFAPAEPDTPMDIYLDNREPDERDSLAEISKKITERKSLNFTNVRKEKVGDGKPRFYDISNLSATYAYTEVKYRDFNIEYDYTKNYRGGLAYSFSNSPKSIEPFANFKPVKKSKYLRLIKDFNFSLAPKTFAVRTDLDRQYGERKIRNLSEATISIDPFVNKSFNWTRAYNLSYDLTKALKIDYSANNRALVREYEGERISKDDNLGGYLLNENNERIDVPGTDYYQLHRDSLLSSLRNLGLTTNFNHTASAAYTVPLNKIPLLDWTSLTSRYSASYDWQRGPLVQPGVEDTLGNTISNSQQLQLNGTLNMTTLYNKVPYLRDLNKPKKKASARQAAAKKEGALKAGTEASTEGEKEKEKEDKEPSKAVKGTLNALMAVKNISGTYTRNRGITLPGYAGQTTAIGMDLSEDSDDIFNQTFLAPGLGFLFGQQDQFGERDTSFADYAARKRWLVPNENIYNPHLRTDSRQLGARASIQPLKDLRIDLTANESFSNNISEYFRYHSNTNTWHSDSTLVETGNYSTSIVSLATAFERVDSSNATIYNQMLSNRLIVSQRLGAERGITTVDARGYATGFDSTHQDVLIPAFFAAYTGGSARTARLNPLSPLRTLMLPNWRINYTGLSKVKFFAKHFKSISLNHSYKSTYTVGGFIKSIGTPDSFDLTERVRPEFIISQVTIQEQFAPLINFDMTWKNSLLTRLELRRDRTATLSTSNGQLTEVGNIEYIVGSGYTVSQLKMPFTVAGNTLKSDLTLRGDFSIRDTRTVIRKIEENTTQITNGQLVYTLKLTADYALTKALNLRLFYDWVANRPAISNSFPTANTNAGFSLRFSLSG